MIDLFDDAQQVRQEILKEMSEFEVIKQELEKFKGQNKILKKKLMEGGGSLDESVLDESNFQDGD